jgi:tRNA U34 5-methylaminomethyl-2-thiouridine-forming methyltransferase MnmC
MSHKFADNIAFYETGDGSLTLINKDNNQTYHSKNGAVQESMHVFIERGLEFLMQQNVKPLKILEVGFGTGLNALLTADSNYIVPFFYHALEPFLVPVEFITRINYIHYLKQKHLKDYFLTQYTREVESEHDPLLIYIGNCEVKVYNTSLELFTSPEKYDLVYYDAFSSQSQQEMWDEDAIYKVVSLMNPGGVFVTYSVTGKLKRALVAAGLQVEKLEGARGKREMLRAVKLMEDADN